MPKKIKTHEKKEHLRRIIHIGKDKWRYKMGDGGVNIRAPGTVMSKYVPYKDLLGPEIYDMQQGHTEAADGLRYKAAISPTVVKKYIEIVFINKEEWSDAFLSVKEEQHYGGAIANVTAAPYGDDF